MFTRIRYDAPPAQALIEQMADDLSSLYGPGTFPPQRAADWAPPEGAFLVATVEAEPIGCGGLIRHTTDTAELKRFFVRPAFRRMGVGRGLLRMLESQALALGYCRVVLETGVSQTPAVAFYKSAGYEAVPCWPPYDEDPTSMCFVRQLHDD